MKPKQKNKRDNFEYGLFILRRSSRVVNATSRHSVTERSNLAKVKSVGGTTVSGFTSMSTIRSWNVPLNHSAAVQINSDQRYGHAIQHMSVVSTQVVKHFQNLIANSLKDLL